MAILDDGIDIIPWRALLRRYRLALALGSAVAVVLLLAPHTPASSSSRAESSLPAQATEASGWQDHASIARLVRPASSNVAPQPLSHLRSAPRPFDDLHAISAWLDPRPTLTGKGRDVVVLATMEGLPWFNQDSARVMPEHNNLVCYTSARGKDKSKAVYATSPSVIQGQDGDAHDKERAWIYVQFICQFRIDDDAVDNDWDSAEVFVALSTPSIDPPPNAFLRVTSLPLPSMSEHKEGKGVSSMCLPPLSGDFYAPFLADYFAHYRALGFSHFYPYLLNPGPETLKVLREMMERDSGIRPVRWGTPKGWMNSRPSPGGRGFAVEPELWDLPGLENLPWDVELELTAPKSEEDVKLWYYGQAPATQDCAFRAMKAGSRWLMTADFDEWLLLRPPRGELWPPSSAVPRGQSILVPKEHNELLTTFLRGVQPKATSNWAVHRLPAEGIRDPQRAMDSEGRLASAYMFRSAFFCMTCRPAQPPRVENGGRKEVEKVLGKGLEWTRPGMEVPFPYSSAVRHREWFWEGVRTKTLVDPWAWRFIGIHDSKTTYLEWAILAGPCATRPFSSAPPRTDLKNNYDPSCASLYLNHLGGSTYLVDPGDTPSNSESAVAPADYSRGALFHVRVAPALRETLVEHEKQFGINGLGQGRREGKELVEKVRVGPRREQWESQFDPEEFGTGGKNSYPPLDLVEDWSFVDVMGRVLAARLRERQREAFGQLEPSEWTWLGWLLMLGGLAWLWTKRKMLRL